jgi:hypothetical protein
MTIASPLLRRLGDPVEGLKLPQQPFQMVDRHHVRAVGRRIVGILMRLDEDASDADRDSRPGEDRNEAAVAAR